MKDNFFIKFKNCLHRTDVMPKYIDQGLGKAIIYGFLICVIFGGIFGIYGGILNNEVITKTIQGIENPKYAFTIKDDQLEMKTNPVKLAGNGSVFYMNDEKTISNSNDIMSQFLGNDAYVLLLKDGVTFDIKGMTQSYKYKDISSKLFGGKTIDNETIGNTLNSWRKYYFSFIVIYSIMEKFANLIMDSFAIALVGLVASMILGMVVRPAALYILAIYAATIPFLISLPIGILYPTVSLELPVGIGTAICVIFILKQIKNKLVTKKNSSKGSKLDRFL